MTYKTVEKFKFKEPIFMDYGIFAYLCGCNFMDVLLSVLLRKLTVSKNFFYRGCKYSKGLPKNTTNIGPPFNSNNFFFYFFFFWCRRRVIFVRYQFWFIAKLPITIFPKYNHIINRWLRTPTYYWKGRK